MNMSKIDKNQKKENLQAFTKQVGEFISPSHISTEPYEIEATAGDLSLLAKYHYKFKEKRQASHVVRPGNTEELSKVMKKCYEFSIPVTIRAAGTSCYSASSPTKGGVIIDMRRMNKIHDINTDNMSVKCDAGTSWLKLIENLLEYGLSPKVYPTSYKSACVGGFVVTSGAVGIGVVKHGPIKDAIISLTVVKPDGSIEKISKASQGDLLIDDIIGSFGIYGAVAEIEMSVTTLHTSMEMIGYSFRTMKAANAYFLTLKNNTDVKPLFLSLSDKSFERYAHWTYPSRDFFVYVVYSDNPDITSKAISITKDIASKFDGLGVEGWYLKEKWRDISDTEVNVGRWAKNLIFQEYWISDANMEKFFQFYLQKTGKYAYNRAYYVIAGSEGKNRIKLFGLSDTRNSREFFGIKAIFHDITLNTYKNLNESLYTIGVVNTLYFTKFNLEKVKSIKKLKNKLDPEDLVNSYRLTKTKMRYWRVLLLFSIAKLLYKP